MSNARSITFLCLALAACACADTAARSEVTIDDPIATHDGGNHNVTLVELERLDATTDDAAVDAMMTEPAPADAVIDDPMATDATIDEATPDAAFEADSSVEAGTTPSGCEIDGVLHEPSSVNPDDACEVCECRYQQ